MSQNVIKKAISVVTLSLCCVYNEVPRLRWLFVDEGSGGARKGTPERKLARRR
jgi:hypothetical protein